MIGLVLAFLGARGLADATQTAFNSLWEVPYTKRPGFPRGLSRSLVLLLLVAVGAASTGWVAAVLQDGSRGVLQRVLLALTGGVVNSLLFVAGFRAATAHEVPTRSLVLGAVLASLAWQVLLGVGGVLVNHSLRGTTSVYGVFAGVLGLLAWFSLQAQVTLYAVEADVVRAKGWWPRSLSNSPMTSADRSALVEYAQAEQRVVGQEISVQFGEHSPDAEVGVSRPHEPAFAQRTALVAVGAGILGLVLGRRRRGPPAS